MYLINKAQDEIKQINQKNLFQKAELRKKYLERISENSIRVRKHFIETYNNSLNKTLSTALLESKEKVLHLKYKLINELRDELLQDIINIIEENYSKKKLKAYTNFLINSIKKVSSIINKLPEVDLILNSKDYNYFNKNSDLLEIQFTNKVNLKKSKEDFIGGFKIIQKNGNIFYDYTIETIISTNESLIQKEFSNIIDDSELRIIEKDFEQFINKNKINIEEYLKEYDRI